jgi:hypothetical protein
VVIKRTVVAATTDTWTKSHATATGTTRNRTFDTSFDQPSPTNVARQVLSQSRRRAAQPTVSNTIIGLASVALGIATLVRI